MGQLYEVGLTYLSLLVQHKINLYFILINFLLAVKEHSITLQLNVYKYILKEY